MGENSQQTQLALATEEKESEEMICERGEGKCGKGEDFRRQGTGGHKNDTLDALTVAGLMHRRRAGTSHSGYMSLATSFGCAFVVG